MASSDPAPAVGIDLGTTFSVVGVYRKRKVEIIQNDAGKRTTPSYVAFTDTEEYVGEAAKEIANKNTLFGKCAAYILLFQERDVTFALKKV